jgi:hypothetical protein
VTMFCLIFFSHFMDVFYFYEAFPYPARPWHFLLVCRAGHFLLHWKDFKGRECESVGRAWCSHPFEGPLIYFLGRVSRSCGCAQEPSRIHQSLQPSVCCLLLSNSVKMPVLSGVACDTTGATAGTTLQTHYESQSCSLALPNKMPASCQWLLMPLLIWEGLSMQNSYTGQPPQN